MPENAPYLSLWQTACFSPLQPYESVTRQYESLGVRFSRAIALRPSNPDFIADPNGLVLMPTNTGQGITLHLRRSIVQVQLQVMGSQPVVLFSLDGAGYCVAQGQLHQPAPLQRFNSNPQGAWQQCLTLATHAVRTVRIGSKAPLWSIASRYAISISLRTA
ncbi:MAG: hypothetical protein HC812_19800, partial [Leptolyngbya sp. RL_3_1]|nr:hypothetical protein [Leptolyngbya sp. RL_3_1]